MSRLRFRSWMILVALAPSLVACPAPTGRTRSRIPGADPNGCSGPTRPNPGDPCDTYETCDYTQPCTGGGMRTGHCTCNGTEWSCMPDPCLRPPVDSGEDPNCPSTTFWAGYECSQLQYSSNVHCRGNVLGCSSEIVQSDCTCGSERRWTCAPGCHPDSGVRDSGQRDATPDHTDASRADAATTCPATPDDGGACAPGLECDYPGACPAYCTCSTSGAFVCEFGACTDAGAPDAQSDVVSDVMGDSTSADAATSCPATPDDGGACTPGLQCDYPGACPAYCTCSTSGAFVCEFGACMEAGAPDAQDDVIGTDVTQPDAGIPGDA